jgi:hypothetical protein
MNIRAFLFHADTISRKSGANKSLPRCLANDARKTRP